MIVSNVLKGSPLKKVETTDRVYSRKALGKEDFSAIREFEKNMNTLPPDKMVEGWITEYLGYPKSINQLNMEDIKAMNRFFKDMNSRYEGDGLPSWVHWADPRTVDEAMWHKERTFYKAGYSIKSPKGGNKVIYKGVGTLGTIRNWFRQTNRQMDVYTDAVPEVNNELYKFRIELTPNESDAIMQGIIAKIEKSPERLSKVAKKYKEQTYTVDKKKYTYNEIVNKYQDIMSKDLETVGREWLYAYNSKGERIKNYDVIDGIRYVSESVDVYNIEVSPNHNYFANDILVHNKATDADVPNPTTTKNRIAITGEAKWGGPSISTLNGHEKHKSIYS